MRYSNLGWGLSWMECSSLGLYSAAFPGAGGMGLLVGGAARGLLWSVEALVVGLDLDVVVSFVDSVWSGAGFSFSLSMTVSLPSQVTDFVGSEGDVSFSVSTV